MQVQPILLTLPFPLGFSDKMRLWAQQFSCLLKSLFFVEQFCNQAEYMGREKWLVYV